MTRVVEFRSSEQPHMSVSESLYYRLAEPLLFRDLDGVLGDIAAACCRRCGEVTLRADEVANHLCISGERTARLVERGMDAFRAIVDRKDLEAALAAAEARAAAAEQRVAEMRDELVRMMDRSKTWRDRAGEYLRGQREAIEQRDAERARADAAVAAAGLLARCVAMMNSMVRSGESHSPTSEIEMRAALDAYSAILAAQQGAEGQPSEGRAP